MSLVEIAQATHGRVVGDTAVIDGVSTDSRRLQPGELFIALQGPNFDGHAFAALAKDHGAAALLVNAQQDLAIPQVVVKDTRVAIGELAAAWRRRFAIPVIALTGSNGKTTVKEMLARILEQQGPVLATRGNLNNDIGVPLTLLRLDATHRAAVIEQGANHAGEIAYLTRLSQPDVALITNAAPAHLAGFGSLEGVARAKGEIYQEMSADGICIVNADDPHAPLWQPLCGERRRIAFSMNDAGAACRARLLAFTGDGQDIEVSTPVGSVALKLALLGRHNIMNALAAVAVASALEVPLSVIKAGLESLRPVPGRLEIKSGIRDARVIDDTYNANPSSLIAALEVLGEFQGRKFLALGDMGELGMEAAAYHRRAGQQARAHGVERLYAVGELSREAVAGFGAQAAHFAAPDPLLEQLRGDLDRDVTVLVKGSRASRMERVVAGLLPEARA